MIYLNLFIIYLFYLIIKIISQIFFILQIKKIPHHNQVQIDLSKLIKWYYTSKIYQGPKFDPM